MSEVNQKLPSLFSVSFRGKVYEIFPFFTLRYLAVVVAVAFLCILIIDRILIPRAEVKSSLDVSGAWTKENNIINANNYKKIKTEPVWQSEGFMVNSAKKTSKRILVMGDSFIWGDGYANINDLWWRQLQTELFRRGYKDIEVIAAGLYGLATRQQLEVAQKVVPLYKPDLVIWGYVPNDPDEEVLPLLTDTKGWKEYDENLKKSYSIHRFIYKKIEPLFPNFFKIVHTFRIRKLLHDNPPPKSAGIPYPEWELQLLHGENLERYDKTLKEVAAFIDQWEIPQFFVTLPNLPSYSLFQIRYAPIKKVFLENNIPFYDMLSEFIDRFGGDKRPVLYWGINPANGHPGSVSTKFYAQFAADLLEKQYPKVLPRKEPTTAKFHVNDWMPWDLKIQSNDQSIEFIYPEKDDLMLRMPYGYPYVQFNLQFPIQLACITLEGDGLKSARLDMTLDDGDDLSVYQLGEKTGNFLTWDLVEKFIEKPAKTIRISATFNKASEGNAPEKLTLKCFGAGKK